MALPCENHETNYSPHIYSGGRIMIEFVHFNFNVLDLEKSIAFYKEAFGLEIVREKNAADGSYKLVYLGDGRTAFQLELTWIRDQKEP